jgi:hypothetical protein
LLPGGFLPVRDALPYDNIAARLVPFFVLMLKVKFANLKTLIYLFPGGTMHGLVLEILYHSDSDDITCIFGEPA